MDRGYDTLRRQTETVTSIVHRLFEESKGFKSVLDEFQEEKVYQAEQSIQVGDEQVEAPKEKAKKCVPEISVEKEVLVEVSKKAGAVKSPQK
jgi:hypothetical protein